MAGPLQSQERFKRSLFATSGFGTPAFATVLSLSRCFEAVPSFPTSAISFLYLPIL